MPAESHNGDCSHHVVKHEIKAKTHPNYRVAVYTVSMDSGSALEQVFIDTQSRWEQSAYGIFHNDMSFFRDKLPRCPMEPDHHLLLCLIYYCDCKIVCLSISPRTHLGVEVAHDMGASNAWHADAFICIVAKTNVIRDCLVDWFQLAWQV